MTIELLFEAFVLPSVMFGIALGGFIFLLGLGINLCLKLFNS